MKKYVLLLASLLFGFSEFVFAKTVRVGYLQNLSNLMSGESEAEEKYGFAYEYLQNIAGYTGWDYEYKYGMFDELYEALVKGEIDLLPDVSYTEERAKVLSYPDYSMGVETYYLYSNGNADISPDDLTTLNGKKLTLGIGSYQYDLFKEWMKNHNVQMNVKELPYHEVTADLLNDGIDDVYLSFDLASEPHWEPVYKIGSSDIFLAVNKNRDDILTELNSALNSLYVSDPYYNNNLWSQYFSHSAMTKRLSKKEMAWITNKKKIVVGCLEGDQPYSGLNKKTGEAEGLVVYIMNHLVSLMNLDDLEIEYKFFHSVSQIYKAINSDEIDLAFPLIYNIFEAENRKLTLSKKVFSCSIGFVHTKENELTNTGLSIAIPEGRRSEDYLLQLAMLEDDELLTYENTEECLEAILTGEVAGGVFNLNQIQNTIFGRRKYSKLIVTEFSEQIPLCFAMKHDNSELLSIMNKVIASTNEAEVQNVVLSNSLNIKKYDIKSFMADYLVVILGILFFIVLILIALMISLGYVKVLINYDTLTHLLNRRSLNPYMKAAINRVKNRGETFSIMIFDLDDFKHINDTYGHACGDEVLKMAAETISKGVKRGDYVFRWGGEEFLVLIKADGDTAAKVADRIRNEIQKQVVVYGEEQISITTTIGIASATETSTVKDIFVIADENLYKGKNNGKNQVVFAPSTV